MSEKIKLLGKVIEILFFSLLKYSKKIIGRPSGLPYYKIIEIDLNRLILRVPSIPLFLNFFRN